MCSLPEGDTKEQVRAIESFIFGTSSSVPDTGAQPSKGAAAFPSSTMQSAENNSDRSVGAAVGTTATSKDTQGAVNMDATSSPQSQQAGIAEPTRSVNMATGPSNTSSISSTSPEQSEHSHRLFPRLHRKSHSGSSGAAPAVISAVAPDHEASSRQLP